MLVDTRKSEYAKLSAEDYGKVIWTGGFWKDAVETCAKGMVPQLQKMFEDNDVSHVVENFRICSGDAEGEFDGSDFCDGDFYKYMEAELYAAIQLKDQERLDRLDYYIDLIARSQQPDGYISTKQIIGGQERLADINAFEVYNMGHLCTSACLHHRLTGKDNFLKVAEKAADFLQDMYDQAEKSGEAQTAVCPSHYMGLVELYRTTGKEKYLKLAKKAIEMRDQVKNGLDDNQDRYPLKSHDKIIGHAVRATYLYAGVADLYAEIGDREYLDMLHRVWKDLLASKIYITGGIGALYNGVSPYGDFLHTEFQKIHQAFGYEYQLPNVTAYNETCANVGLVMWAYRMFMLEPKAEYFDIIERVMLNTNLAAVSLDGKKYFYENMLRRSRKEQMKYNLLWPLTRTEYLISYCCPPNLARNIMQSGEYAYSFGRDCIYLGMYGENRAEVKLDNGAEFTLIQTTEYPYQGAIHFTAENVRNNQPVRLMLRIPAWMEEGSLSEAGSVIRTLTSADRGYLEVPVEDLTKLDLTLTFEMPVRFTIANSMVEEDTEQAAIEKGPLVYCMESMDTDCDHLEDISLDCTAGFTEETVEIMGHTIQALRVTADMLCRESFDRSRLYQPLKKLTRRPISLRMIPYFAWDNRGYGEMKVWIPYH